MRGVDHFDWLETRLLDAVEQALGGPEKEGNDVESEFFDRSCCECLPHSRGATGDGDFPVAGCGVACLSAASKPSVMK